jgi:hypothetical protein
MPSEVAVSSESREAAENNEKSVVSEDKEEGESKTPLATVAQAFVDSKMEQEKKDELLSDANLALTTMTFEEMKSAGAEIISGFDSVEQAVDEVRKPGTNIPIELRSVILGEGMKYAQTKQKEAKTEAEKNKWADYEIDLVKELTQAARSMGRFNAYIAQLYEQSPYSIVRETKREIEDKNKLFAPDAKQNAKDVKAILENEEDLEASFERAITEAVEISNKERDKKIAELEKKLAQSQKAPNQKNTTARQRKYRYTDGDKKKFLDGIKNIKSGGGPLIILNSAISNPELWKNLGGLAGYYIERGYYKFEDFYKKLKKDLGGEFEDSYGDLYNEAKQVAIESGVDPKEFDGDDAVRQMVEDRLSDEEELARLKKEKEVADLTAEFGKALSKQLPDLSLRASKEQKVREIAEKLDDIYGGTAFSDIADDYFNISKEEKEQREYEKNVKAFTSLVSEGKKQVEKDERTREQKIRDRAKALDGDKGTVFSDIAEKYITQKEVEAANEKAKSEIESKKKGVHSSSISAKKNPTQR